VRPILFLLLGLAAGFGAGWVLFSSESGTRATTPARPRSADVPKAHEVPIADDDAPSPEARGETPGPTGETARRWVEALERTIVRAMVLDAYRTREGDDAPAPAEDLLEAAVDEVLRRADETRRNHAAWVGLVIPSRARRRAEVGEIRASPLLLQVRAFSHATAQLSRAGNSGPLDIEPPLAADERRVHVSGGTVPPGKVFLVERVLLRARTERGRCSLSLPRCGHLQWEMAVSVELRGLVPWLHGLGDVQLAGSHWAASAELHGRLVPAAEANELPRAHLRMVTGSGDGWLTKEPVVLQVIADHGGGSDRKVRLDGTVYRIDTLAPDDLWTETPDLRNRRRSSAHYRGCGLVPPGKAYRITRIDYRAILDERENQHSRFVIEAMGAKLVEENAVNGARVVGSWTGEILIPPGREDTVAVVCNYYGLGEAVVYGTIVDPPSDAR
jgi:hypothetical protein